MDDLDDVRAALGYETIDIYGASYGTTAAQVYLLRHEAHVRTASLVVGSLLDIPLFERYPASSQAALELVLARCESDATCRAAFPDVRHQLAEILAQLDKGPITVPIVDPQTGQPGQFTRDMLDSGLHYLLRNTATAVVVPKAIQLFHSGDWGGLAALTAPSVGTGDAGASWAGMNLTIICHEEWATLRPAETAAFGPGSYLQYADVRALTVPEEICGVMPRPETAALYGPATRSAVPMLLLNGQADPQDPPGNGAAAPQRYPNSRTLVAPGQAHVSTGGPCRAAITADFLEHGSVAGLSPDCLDRVGPPPLAK